MIDFNGLRQSMVDSQIRPSDVTDARIIEAMLDLPRERFVPDARQELAYLDDDLVVRESRAGSPARYLMEPMTLARLIQALALRSEDRVLDVGCATGYSTALLAKLAKTVVGLESDEELAEAARAALASVEAGNAEVVTGLLTAGAPNKGPYDAILVNGSVGDVPQALFDQLADHGRLVAILRRGPVGRATLYVKASGGIGARPVADAAVPMLPGFEVPEGFVF